MSDLWRPRCPPPKRLVVPRPIDPQGRDGPTANQARGPYWRRSSPGLYVPADTDSAQVEQRILEAVQRLPAGGAVSGWAALRLAGGGFFDGLRDDGRTPRPVRLVVPPGRNLRALGLTVVARERLAPAEITERHGVPCTSAARAAFDEARMSPDLRSAVVAMDMALAAGLVAFEELRAHVAECRRWPGARQARAAVLLADDRSLSPGETRMRLVWVLDAGLPRPLCNWPVADLHGRRLGRPDLLDDELGVVGEYDGAHHRTAHQHARDVAREERFRAAGLEYFTVVGPDQYDIALVRARIEATCARARRRAEPRRWLVARDPGPL